MVALFLPTIPFSSSALSPSLTLQPSSSSPPSYLPFSFHYSSQAINFTPPETSKQILPLSVLNFRPLHSTSCSSSAVTATDGLFRLFRQIGLNERESELLLEKNPSLKFEFFDLINGRIHSFQSIGVDGNELCRLVTKCPDVLTASEIGSILRFIEHDLEGDIASTQLGKLLASIDLCFLVGFDTKVKLLLQFGIPREKLAHVLSNVSLSKAICLKTVEDIDRMLQYLKRFGGVDIIVRHPVVLNYDMDTQLVPKIEFLMELGGGDEEAVGVLLRKFPALLRYSIEHFEDHVEFFRSYAGLLDEEIFKIFLVFPGVVSASRKRKLHPRVEFLKQCGLTSNEMFKLLVKAPLFLALSFENINCKLCMLVKIGYEYKTKELATALGAVTRTNCGNLQKVLGLFLAYGLTCEEIVVITKKHPQILQYSSDSLEEKMEYLTEDMGREVRELLSFPAFLGYNLDERIKQRYETKKKTAGGGMSINKLLTVSEARFSRKKIVSGIGP